MAKFGSTAICDYQISLIESRGPNSRGVHMLRVGLACISGKTYVPQPVTTTILTPLLNEQGVDLKMPPPLDNSIPSSIVSRNPRPLATCEHQIALIESRGPNSRGANLLHAGLADLAKSTPLQPGQLLVMANLLLEPTKHIRNFDGQFFRLYLSMLEVKPSCTKCVGAFIFVYNFSAILNI